MHIEANTTAMHRLHRSLYLEGGEHKNRFYCLFITLALFSSVMTIFPKLLKTMNHYLDYVNELSDYSVRNAQFGFDAHFN